MALSQRPRCEKKGHLKAGGWLTLFTSPIAVAELAAYSPKDRSQSLLARHLYYDTHIDPAAGFRNLVLRMDSKTGAAGISRWWQLLPTASHCCQAPGSRLIGLRD